MLRARCYLDSLSLQNGVYDSFVYAHKWMCVAEFVMGYISLKPGRKVEGGDQDYPLTHLPLWWLLIFNKET